MKAKIGLIDSPAWRSFILQHTILWLYV